MIYTYLNSTPEKIVEVYPVDELLTSAKDNWDKLPKFIKIAYEEGGLVFTDNQLYHRKNSGRFDSYAVCGQSEDIEFVTKEELALNYYKGTLPFKINLMKSDIDAGAVGELREYDPLKGSNSPQQEKAMMELITQRDEIMNKLKQTKSKKEAVDHPNHYGGDNVYETIKVLKAWLTPEQYEGFLIGNGIKYDSRYRHKGGLEDIKKSDWYKKELLKEYASGYFK